MKTKYPGINYALGTGVNQDRETGIRYGVIPLNAVCQAWCDTAQQDYGKPHCPKCENELPEGFDDGDTCPCGHEIKWVGDECYPDEPLSETVEEDGLKAVCDSQGDIFVIHSPYYTHAQFCSPCAPGACYLLNWLDEIQPNNRAYCFGPDWFEDGKAPYPIYSVETGLPARFPHPESHLEGFEP